MNKMKAEDYLMNLVKSLYPQGDHYHVSKSKKGKWHFGYYNDSPMQHTEGRMHILDENVVNFIIKDK